jgi:hypothetical protein
MAKLKEMPFEIGMPDEPEASPMATDGEIPGYMEPHKKCANCEYFDGDSECRKYNAPCDMDGNCPSWEEPEEGMSDADTEEPGEVDRY